MSSSSPQRRLVIGISGSSGAIYGARLVEALADVAEVETHLVISAGARATLAYETDHEPDDLLAAADVAYDDADVAAAIASGTFRTAGMIVAPCSMRTLSGIATSNADNLVVRAADVCLKERRRLVLLARETPLHAGHLRLMTQVTEAGGVVLPAAPGFYHRPRTVMDLVDQVLTKALDQFDIDAGLIPRWRGIEA